MAPFSRRALRLPANAPFASRGFNKTFPPLTRSSQTHQHNLRRRFPFSRQAAHSIRAEKQRRPEVLACLGVFGQSRSRVKTLSQSAPHPWKHQDGSPPRRRRRCCCCFLASNNCTRLSGRSPGIPLTENIWEQGSCCPLAQTHDSMTEKTEPLVQRPPGTE